MTSQDLRTIILDFDGVLVESNDIKDKAFEAVFAAYPQHLKAIIAYHHSVTAIRFEKFRYVHEHILHLPYNAAIEKQLGDVFAEFCVAKVSVCPSVRGANEFLKYFYGRIPLYLVTINPQADLDIILKNRGLEYYFKGVYPVTGSKQKAIEQILSVENISKNQALFIGDSQGDADSAKAAGVEFIGRQSDMVLKDVPVVFDDMHQVLEQIRG